MARILKDRSKKHGLPPGSLIPVVDDNNSKDFECSIFEYDAVTFTESASDKLVSAIRSAQDKRRVTWVALQGLSDPKRIEEIGKLFGIQGLWIEDVLNTDHRPKLEELSSLIFLILKSPRIEALNPAHIEFEQINLFLGDGFVLSVQERLSNVFEFVTKRIRDRKGIVREKGADYLFYALLDTVIDNYFVVTEKLSLEIETIEEEVNEFEDRDFPVRINRLKTETIFLKKAIVPIREALTAIIKSQNQFLEEKTKIYLNDVLDHVIQIIDVNENNKELLVNLAFTHQSKLNQRTNEIVKVLTLFASIFSPLTFIVGVYGMNFTHMPEYQWEHGYAFIWLLIAFVAGMMLYLFKRKGWF
ncbi:MAG: magnesium and cobalt transport protein CorA [Bdellovibrionales bacterium CG10_big_fil_rev_8_21_14_0_10_45_34]|nr:MAG: magnesium and cobalt transport protein CorA [Bdellovibrionales bacterium CG10_big_fil_rev_8_21_14_0_10_45_34]